MKNILIRFSIFTGLLLSLIAQERPQWDDIPSGQYKVGFKVIHTYDYSRGYWPKIDHNSEPVKQETARPMQISIWYPAKLQSENEQMVFGDYIELKASELGLEKVTDEKIKQAKEALRAGPLNPFYPEGVGDEDLQKVLETPVPVVKNADPANGSFPLVIHAGYGLMGQSVLNEYLASQGYVVATFPVLSTHPAWYHRGEGTMEWYQAIADDIGFVYGKMKEFLTADCSQAAVIGMFAPSAFLFQMQNMQLNAIASLDGRMSKVLKSAPGFNYDKIRIPVLDMPSITNQDKSVMIDSMRFAEKYSVRFDSVEHREFYQFRRVAHPGKSDEDTAYKIIARYTKAFLDARLKYDKNALAFLNQEPKAVGAPENFMSISKTIPAVVPPTENEFLLLLRNNAVDKAEEIYRKINAELPDYEICDESSLRTVAFFFRRDNGAEESIKLFKLWSEMFPNSLQAKIQLGNTYQAAGDIESTIETYTAAKELVMADETMPKDEKENLIKQIEDEIESMK